MLRIRPHFLVSIGISLAVATAPTTAGSIVIAWDAAQGATGYEVSYGTQSGNYTESVNVSSTSTTLSGLQDCTTYYVAVKAFNEAGKSPTYSNELSGWSRPRISSTTPTTAMQGDQIVMDVTGNNFLPGATVDLGNPNVVLTSIQRLSCTHIQLIATVEPTAASIRPAQIGRLDLTVTNPPDSVFGSKSNAFEVLINPARFDINQSDEMTTNRIDGKDTVYLSREFGRNESDPNYEPDDDFDGDGWVDGQDLAYIASNLGRCWSASTKSWSLAACPSVLQ